MRLSLKNILIALGLLVLVGGAIAAVILVRERQLLNQKASENGTCPSILCGGSLIEGSVACVDQSGTNQFCCPADSQLIDGKCSPSSVSASCPCHKADGTTVQVGQTVCSDDAKSVLTCEQSSPTSGCQLNPAYSCGTGTSCIGTVGQVSCAPQGGGTTTQQTTTGGGGGTSCDGTCSDYCAGADQCASQGGHDVGRGCSIGACSGTAIHCFIPAACPAGGSAGGGTSQTTVTTTKSQCGGTCNTTSDCQPAANGGTVSCTNGICQNASCIGKTIPGANCDCSALNACGNPCSASLGLCQSGSICRYIVGSSCTLTSSSNPTTYCVPTTLPTGWTTASCISRDQGNSYVLNAGTNPTVAQIQQACNPSSSSTQLASAPTSSPTLTPQPTTTPTNPPTTTPTSSPGTERISLPATGAAVPVTGDLTPTLALSMMSIGLISISFVIWKKQT